MPKAYNIKDTIKDKKGVIQEVITQGGMTKSKQEVINDINKGYNVNTVDDHNHKTKVINVNDEYVRTVPNKKDCDNLGDL